MLCPSEFPILTKYLTSLPNPNQRASTSTACARLEKLNGRNYFICVKQLIQGEKKIRVMNLQQNVLKSSSKLLSFDEIPLPPTSSKKIVFKKFDWLVSFFSELSLDELSCIDAVRES